MLAFLLSMTDDEEERARFEVLYRAYRQDMFQTAYGILKNKYDAEDAVSQTFMNIIGKPDITKSKPCPRKHGYCSFPTHTIAAFPDTAEKAQPELFEYIYAIDVPEGFEVHY